MQTASIINRVVGRLVLQKLGQLAEMSPRISPRHSAIKRENFIVISIKG